MSAPFLDWIGFALLAYGQWDWTINPYTKAGRWCLSRAGSHAYRCELRGK